MFSMVYYVVRWQLEVICEAVGGTRVSEATGTTHGVLANNTSIITAPWATQVWDREVVELKLEHTKNGTRYVDMAGTTVNSGIKVADTLRRFWAAAGLETTIGTDAGATVERPDYWVVRVSLLPFVDEEALQSLFDFVDNCPVEDVRRHARNTKTVAKRRLKSSGDSSQEKKHVHISGGRATSGAVGRALALAKAAGFDVCVVPGPLLRATSGALVTHHSLETGGTFEKMAEILDGALELANTAGSPDPDLSSQDRITALWNNHSLRRLGDARARRDMDDTSHGRKPVEKWQIDLQFGWNEAKMSRDMQIFYAAMNLRARLEQARMTCLL